MPSTIAPAGFRTRPRTQQMPRSYGEAAQILGSRESRVIANNTRLIWTPSDGSLSVKLHDTVIVTWFVPSAVFGESLMTLKGGGYRTDTTKNRLQRCLPEGWTLRGSTVNARSTELDPTWIIRDGATGRWAFYDGITFDIANTVHQAA